MSGKMFLIALLSFGLVGCATTQDSASIKKIQYRVVDLEKKLEDRDREVVDLQYEVKELTERLESSTMKTSFTDNSLLSSKTAAASSSKDEVDYSVKNTEIIRVSARADQVQLALKNAGFYKGAVDSKIGPGTQQAIMAFQKSHNVKADGIIGKNTWSLLSEYLK